jgi:very-short-patch-repair endonuclease
LTGESIIYASFFIFGFMSHSSSSFRFGWKKNEELRRGLRKNATRAEQVLWNELRARRLGGLKFRRQHGIGNWIVDFYHGISRTIIELDGSVHDEEEVRELDKVRQEYLEDLDCTVLRFRNEEVLNNLKNVLAIIQNHIIRAKIRKPWAS